MFFGAELGVFFGHPRHEPRSSDLAILRSMNCGWLSREMTREQLAQHGFPLHCESPACHGRHNNIQFVIFDPQTERERAYQAIGLSG